MFSGIIKELASVVKIEPADKALTLQIKTTVAANYAKLGSSIAIDGVCLTVVAKQGKILKFDISPQTLAVTLFESYKIDQILNIEPALLLGQSLDGHLVQGHVDGWAELVNIKTEKNFYNFDFKLPKSLLKYVSYKASLTLNGISLTVASLKNDICTTAIVPFTYLNTNLQFLKVGQKVHCETDLLARYLERLTLKNI